MTYNDSKKYNSVLEDIVEEPAKLKLPMICEHCHTKRFSHETKNLCCSNGEISLIINDAPQELYDLFTFTSDECQQF